MRGLRGAVRRQGALVALCLMAGPGAAGAQATTTTSNVTIPLGLAVFVPCAVGGAGETVALDGEQHVVFHTTVDDAGGLHVTSHSDDRGVSGVGLATGTAYRASGTTENTFNSSGPQQAFEFTFRDRLRLLGQGDAPDLALLEREHVTVNADGTVTAVIASIEADCG